LVHDRCQVCYPLVELDCVKHEPDNRFVECALAIDADYLVTVNTARGHFDKPAYGRTRVLTPGAFLNLPEVRRLLRQF
jgi:predicted nucleic acid-binding protein